MFKIVIIITFLAFALVSAAPGDNGMDMADANSMRGKNIIVLKLKSETDPVDGYLMELLSLLQAELGFNQTIEEVEKRGVADSDGKWDGMIGRLVDGTADLALADLTITSVRSDAIAFTIPYLVTGVSILIRKSDVGSMKSAKDLAQQETIKYGSIRYGSTTFFFRKSDDPLYSKMFDAMAGSCPQTLVETAAEGIQKVKAGGFALLAESNFIEYQVARDCELQQLGAMLNTVKHALGTQKNTPYTGALSWAIQKLLDNGKLAELQDKHWRRNTDVDCNAVKP
jgi:ABC-type amino acid transport substrate-binding protein